MQGIQLPPAACPALPCPRHTAQPDPLQSAARLLRCRTSRWCSHHHTRPTARAAQLLRNRGRVSCCAHYRGRYGSRQKGSAQPDRDVREREAARRAGAAGELFGGNHSRQRLLKTREVTDALDLAAQCAASRSPWHAPRPGGSAQTLTWFSVQPATSGTIWSS